MTQKQIIIGAVVIVAIIALYFIFRPNPSKGITISNLDKANKVFDASFNYGGQTDSVTGGEWKNASDYILTDLKSTDRYSFRVGKFGNTSYAIIDDRNTGKQVSEKIVDWSKV